MKDVNPVVLDKNELQRQKKSKPIDLFGILKR